MKCPRVKLLDHQVTWLGLEVHACCSYVSARPELPGVDKVNFSSVAGEFRLRTSEFKTAGLADNTTAAIATHEPFTFKRLVTCPDSYSVRALMKANSCK